MALVHRPRQHGVGASGRTEACVLVFEVTRGLSLSGEIHCMEPLVLKRMAAAQCLLDARQVISE